jgi:hypothetical protein
MWIHGLRFRAKKEMIEYIKTHEQNEFNRFDLCLVLLLAFRPFAVGPDVQCQQSEGGAGLKHFFSLCI